MTLLYTRKKWENHCNSLWPFVKDWKKIIITVYDLIYMTYKRKGYYNSLWHYIYRENNKTIVMIYNLL